MMGKMLKRPAPAMLEEDALTKQSQSKEIWRRFRQNKLAMVGLVIVLMMVLVALLANVIAPYDPNVMDGASRLEKPSALHLLGTDAGAGAFTVHGALLRGNALPCQLALAGNVHLSLQLVPGIVLFLPALLAVRFSVHFDFLCADPGAGTISVHSALLLLYRVTCLGSFTLAARVLRPHNGALAGAGLGISTPAGRTLVLLVGRVFIGSIEVTVYVLTVFVADQFARIVPVSAPLAALTVRKVFPVIHSFYPFLRFTQFTFYSCGAIIFMCTNPS